MTKSIADCLIYAGNGYDITIAFFCSCAGNGALAFLSTLTLVILVLLGIYVYKVTRTAICPQLVIVLVSILLQVSVFLHFSVLGYVQFAFVSEFLLVDLYISVCFFFFIVALQLTSREKLIKIYVYPTFILSLAFSLALFFFTQISPYVPLISQSLDCRGPSWFMYSATAFVLTFIFLVTFLVISRSMKNINIPKEIITKKKRLMALILFVDFIVCSINCCSDLLLFIFAASPSDCDTFLINFDIFDVTANLCLKILRYFLPVWVICFVLYKLHRAPKRTGLVAPDQGVNTGDDYISVSFPVNHLGNDIDDDSLYVNAEDAAPSESTPLLVET